MDKSNGLIMGKRERELIQIDAYPFFQMLKRSLNFLNPKKADFGRYLLLSQDGCVATDGLILYRGPGINCLENGEQYFLLFDSIQKMIDQNKRIEKISFVELNLKNNILTYKGLLVPLEKNVPFPSWRNTFQYKKTEPQLINVLYYNAENLSRILKGMKDITIKLYPSSSRYEPTFGSYSDGGEFIIMPETGQKP